MMDSLRPMMDSLRPMMHWYKGVVFFIYSFFQD
jgi:hypothetical protein